MLGSRVYGCAEKYLSTKVQTNVGEQCQVGAKAHHPVDDDVNYLVAGGKRHYANSRIAALRIEPGVVRAQGHNDTFET